MKNTLFLFFLFICNSTFSQYLRTDGSNWMTGQLNITTPGYSAIELRSNTGSFIDFHSSTSSDFDGRIIWNFDNSKRFDIYGNSNFKNSVTVNGNITGNSIIPKKTLRLPSIYASANNNYFKEGTGDGGSLTTYNTFLRLHYGMAIGSPFTSNGNGGFEEKATISFNGRSGDIFTLGKIGIGTTKTGSHKLAVDGSIGAKEIKVETVWSDFVFDEDYDLKSIEEVEQYIKENGHLSEIPDQETVEKDGVNLGEMNAKLLQKIEELTLYTIDINKRLKSQNEHLEQLEQENLKLKKEVSALKN
jgi:hypothetical protein